LNADLIAGERHLHFAVGKALWAIAAGRNIANDPEIENRFLYLLAAYWFVFELVVHVGIIELDPYVWKYHKAIFWSGKENLSDRHFVKVIEEDEQKRAAKVLTEQFNVENK